jgi:hypothetical protein
MKRCSFGLSVFLLSALMLTNTMASAQDEDRPVEQRKIPFSIGIEGGISSLATPEALRVNFNSLGDVKLNFNFGLGRRFRTSAQLKYSGFQVRRSFANKPDTIIDGLVYDTRTTMNLVSTGLFFERVSWVGNYSFFSMGMGAGKTFGLYSQFRSSFKGDKKAANFKTNFIEPRIQFSYFFEDYLGLNISASYTHVFGYFSPDKIGLNNGILSYTQDQLDAEIGYFNISLGFTWSLKRID